MSNFHYVLEVTTTQHLFFLMKRDKLSHYPYQVPMLIGKKLTREVIEEAIQVLYNESDYNYLISGKIKKFDLVFHTRLMQTFPDWEARMNYQKKQEELYKSAMKKKNELKKIRMRDNPKFYTKKELDTINYFHGCPKLFCVSSKN